jgi:hypothetical protein
MTQYTDAQKAAGRTHLESVADDIAGALLKGEAATKTPTDKGRALSWAAILGKDNLVDGTNPELLTRIDLALMLLGGISLPTVIKVAVDMLAANPVTAPQALTDDPDPEPEIDPEPDPAPAAPVAPKPAPPKPQRQQGSAPTNANPTASTPTTPNRRRL